MGQLISKFVVNKWDTDNNEARPASQTASVGQSAAIPVPRNPGLGPPHLLERKRSSAAILWNGALKKIIQGDPSPRGPGLG